MAAAIAWSKLFLCVLLVGSGIFVVITFQKRTILSSPITLYSSWIDSSSNYTGDQGIEPVRKRVSTHSLFVSEELSLSSCKSRSAVLLIPGSLLLSPAFVRGSERQ